MQLLCKSAVGSIAMKITPVSSSPWVSFWSTRSFVASSHTTSTATADISITRPGTLAGDAVQATWRKLAQLGIPEPETSAEYLMRATILGPQQLQQRQQKKQKQKQKQKKQKRIQLQQPPLHKWREHVLTVAEARSFDALVERRAISREPVQYLLGEWDFRNLTLELVRRSA